MKVATSSLVTTHARNAHPNLPNLLITTNISPVYVHFNNVPDIGYQENSDVIISWYSVIVPKALLITGEFSFYQSTGTDGYVSITEVL